MTECEVILLLLPQYEIWCWCWRPGGFGGQWFGTVTSTRMLLLPIHSKLTVSGLHIHYLRIWKYCIMSLLYPPARHVVCLSFELLEMKFLWTNIQNKRIVQMSYCHNLRWRDEHHAWSFPSSSKASTLFHLCRPVSHCKHVFRLRSKQIIQWNVSSHIVSGDSWLEWDLPIFPCLYLFIHAFIHLVTAHFPCISFFFNFYVNGCMVRWLGFDDISPVEILGWLSLSIQK